MAAVHPRLGLASAGCHLLPARGKAFAFLPACRILRRSPWLFLVGFLLGCAAREDVVYTSLEKLKELPENHRRQIQQGLAAHFGTPLFPHIRLLKAKSVDSSGASATEGAAPASTESAGAASANASTAEQTDPSSGKLPPGFEFAEWKDPWVLQQGAIAYRKRCAACHGVTGDGQGPVAQHLKPLPRDYRHGVFKFISTQRSSKPRRADLLRIVRYGAKGTSMPAFRWLEASELEAIVDYVIHLSVRGEVERQLQIEAETEFSESDEITPDYFASVVARVTESWQVPPEMLVQPVTPEPPKTEVTIEAGRKAFLTRGCQQCHGVDGRGRANDVGQDQWGHLAYAADITAGTLHGGRRPVDIYRRIYTGINGTPMPGFGQTLEQEPETLWHLVHYVQELAGGRKFDNSDSAAIEAAGKQLPASSESPATP